MYIKAYMLNTWIYNPWSKYVLRKRRLDYSAPFWRLCVILVLVYFLVETTVDQFPEHQSALPATQTSDPQV